jgi:hypothetical protein
MNFVCAMIKKELTEILYAKKSLILVAVSIVGVLYMCNITDSIVNNTDNVCYLITILMSITSALQFMSESILSDKRNQTLEIMAVSGKLGLIFFIKILTIILLCLIPFIIFYVYFKFNGYNILNSILLYVNTLFLFWISGCAASMIVIFFNDERTAAMFGVISLLLTVGLVKIMFFLNNLYNEMAGALFLSLLAVCITGIANLFFKHTKIYLKNL